MVAAKREGLRQILAIGFDGLRRRILFQAEMGEEFGQVSFQRHGVNLGGRWVAL